jgi:hypothetical protein
VDPRAGLYSLEVKKPLAPAANQAQIPWSWSPYTSHYTDSAIRAFLCYNSQFQLSGKKRGLFNGYIPIMDKYSMYARGYVGIGPLQVLLRVSEVLDKIRGPVQSQEKQTRP